MLIQILTAKIFLEKVTWFKGYGSLNFEFSHHFVTIFRKLTKLKLSYLLNKMTLYIIFFGVEVVSYSSKIMRKFSLNVKLKF